MQVADGQRLDKARPYIQHNVFLAYLTELGLPGLGLYLVVLGLWGQSAWRLWRSPDAPPWIRRFGLLILALLANYAVNGMFHDMTLIPMVNMVLYFFGGAAVALSQEWAPMPSAESERSPAASPAVSAPLPPPAG